MESKECFDYLYWLSPKRLVINREISPFSVFTDQSLFIAELGWVGGSEDFGCVTLKRLQKLKCLQNIQLAVFRNSNGMFQAFTL